MISKEKPWMKYFKDVPDEKAAECKAVTFVYNRNKDNPGDIALNYFGHEITFGELFEQIKRTAASFVKHGVKKGDIVSVCSVKTPEIVYAFYALDYIGATGNMIDPRSSTQGVHDYFEEVDSRLVITLDVAYPRAKAAAEGTAVREIIVVSPADSLAGIKKPLYKLSHKDKNQYDGNALMWKDFIESGRGTEAQEAAYDPDHAAVIVHTGGTTGLPKGVCLPDKAFNALAVQYGINGFVRRDRFLDVMPPFIAYGFAAGTHLPLCFGVADVIIPSCEREEMGELVMKYKPAHMAATPMHYITMIQHPKLQKADLSFLKTPGAGGDGMNLGGELAVNEFFRSHGCKTPIAKGWGMTECCSTAATCMGEAIYKPGSVGVPLCMTTVSVFDPDTGRELDYNQQGELAILSPNVMLGYYHNPAETANALRRHEDGAVWLHTGDIGHMDEDGFIFIDSRIKRIIIRSDGFKVFPANIENAVSKYDGVEVCSSVGVRDTDCDQGQTPVVFVVLKKEYTGREKEAEEAIRRLCEENIPSYMFPAKYFFVDALPYTPIGKVDYRKLEEQAVSLSA